MTDQWRSVATDPPCEKGSHAHVLGCIAGASAPLVLVADRHFTDEIRWMIWDEHHGEWVPMEPLPNEGFPTYWLPCPVPPAS